MNVSDHTQRVFDSDLSKLTQMVAEMGGLAQKQVTDSIDALARHDVGLARRVIALDGTVDGMLRQIEEKAVATIALRQPMAFDLRALVAMLRIASDLERIGDLAKNVGKRVIAVSGENSQRTLMRGLRHLATLVVSQLAVVLDSFVERVAEIGRGANAMNCGLCKYRTQMIGYETDAGAAQAGHHHHVCGIGTDADHHHDHDHHHGDAHHRHTDHQNLGVEPHVHGPDCGHDHDHDHDNGHDHDHHHGHGLKHYHDEDMQSISARLEGDLDPAHLPDREVPDPIGAAIGHIHAIQHLGDKSVRVFAGDSVQCGVIHQVLAHRNIDIERAGLKDDAELAEGCTRFARNIMTENPDLTRPNRIEARDQRKTPESHWAHMTVHGVLHLLGFDHEVESEAVKMAAREIQILDRLGFSDPYR